MSATQLVMTTILIIGLIMILIDVIISYNRCPPKTVEYRFIPRNFLEEQESQIPLDSIFYNMFNSPDTWVGIVDLNERKKDLEKDINKYFISQA